MTTLHPHWHEDDGEPVPVREASAAKESEVAVESPQSRTFASRRPAAIAGMIIAGMALVGMFWSPFAQAPAQLSQNVFTVVITEDGVRPEIFVAAPGDVIEYLNLMSEAQIVEFTYRSREGSPTASILPQARYRTTIPHDAPEGEFRFQSIDGMYGGRVIVKKFDADDLILPDESGTLPSDDAHDQFAAGGGGFIEGPLSSSAMSASSAPTSPFPDPFEDTHGSADEERVTQAIPKNPYTVDYGRLLGNVSARPGQTVATGATHGAAPKPKTNPLTGPGETFVVALSIGAMLWLTRKYFTPSTKAQG